MDYPITDFLDPDLPWVTLATVPKYWTDTDIFEDSEELSDTALVYAIFSNPYARLDLGTAGIDAANPVATFKTADIPGATGGDLITIQNIEYEVGTPKPDGTGLTTIDLVRRV